MDITEEERIRRAKDILEKIKDETKNRSDLAKLYAYVANYEEAVLLYLRNSDYKKFYKYLNKVSS